MATESKLRLTAKEILEKDFKTSMRGYDKDEIDKYLDLIIKDYEAFESELNQVKQENMKLRKEYERLQESQSKQPSPSNGNTNYDILKRLSNLEKHVFGNKLYD